MTAWYTPRVLLTNRAFQQPCPAELDQVLDRLRLADPTVVRQVYQQHNAAVRAFAQRLTGNQTDAEDLVQETFVALPQAVGNFRRDCSLRSFIIGVAANRARQFVRSAMRRRAALDGLAREPQPLNQTPDDMLTREQLAQRLIRALDRLPLEQRVAFVLCAVEERTSGEVARMVGAPDSTVRARVRLAKQRLRELLHEEDPP